MKKILALAVAAMMVITACMCISAAGTESVSLTCEGYFNNWTRSFEIPDEGSLVLNIDHTCNAVYNWEGIVAVYTPTAFAGNDATHPRSTDFYAAIRGDIYVNEGDGGSVKNSDVTFTHNIPDANANNDIWDDYRDTMKDCDIVATFTKSATGFGYQYAVTGANGTTFTISGTAVCDVEGDLYVLFTGEWCSYTITVPEVETDGSSSDEASSDAESSGEESSGEESSDAESSDEVSSDEVSSDEVSSDEVSSEDSTTEAPDTGKSECEEFWDDVEDFIEENAEEIADQITKVIRFFFIFT